jgi:DNA repair photolyase
MPPDQRSLFDGPADLPPRVPGVVIRETPCKSVLNPGGIADYSFNGYTGCTHACAYCYARYMLRFHPHGEPWGQFVDVKINAPDVLARQLRRLPPGTVFSCSACDGWQPIEEHYQITRRCCDLLLGAGFRLNVLTKNRLVLRDLDIFAGRAVRLGVTITTVDEGTAALWEPGASTVADRVEVLRQAKAAGLETTVMFGPLLPGISDTPESLSALVALAGDANVDHIHTDAMNPRSGVWPAVQALLNANYPHLREHVQGILFDPAEREAYKRALAQRIAHAARQAGLEDRL